MRIVIILLLKFFELTQHHSHVIQNDISDVASMLQLLSDAFSYREMAHNPKPGYYLVELNVVYSCKGAEAKAQNKFIIKTYKSHSSPLHSWIHGGGILRTILHKFSRQLAMNTL